MRLFETGRLAYESIVAHKSRALLTMLGLIIGVASIILLVSLGVGARLYILNEFQSLGTNLIIIQPGKSDKKGALGPPIGAAQRKMTIADVQALERLNYNLESLTGLTYGTTSIRFDETIADVNLFGSGEQFTKVLNLKVATGRFFSEEEDSTGRRVVVLGAKVAQDILPDREPVGQRVKIARSEFRVIGVMQAAGSKLGFNIDEFIFIPLRSSFKIFNDDKLFGIRAKARSRAAVDDAVVEIKTILKERRDGEEDFTVVTQASMMESLETILGMLTYVLAAIGCISVLVAGIGIMNIMLVTVAERTQEIGIRRAVGATKSNIVQQFLVEAVVLSTLGGTLGISVASAFA